MSSKNHKSIDEELGKVTAVQLHAQQRRKCIGNRVWLVVSELGESHFEEVGKQSIMRTTGLPARDLRILDPMLSYPSTILGRERAIVINLEHIKAIITAKEVWMANSTNPLVVEFIEDLKHRISSTNGVPANENADTDMKNAVEATCASPSLHSHHSWSQNFNASPDMPNTEKNSRGNMMVAPVAAGPKLLPFEFRALEACLESTCRCLESETQALEQEAYPALDELTSEISTLNLEHIRQIKSHLVTVSARVQKVRDGLEYVLDDDNDMAGMYLTEKLDGQLMDQTSQREELYNEALEVDDERSEETKSDHNSEISPCLKPNIEELEMLLEAYFSQIDGISRKLFHMNEYVDDTEDCINIMLDEKRNQLLKMGVMFSTANMILNAGIVVVGLFGMNIGISLFDGQPVQFWETVFGTVGGCVALYLIAVGWGRKKSLL
ncbi:hypothetical protein F0562_003485 [Nyssa sinensis]|uniref:Magnesium transporter n=1 Tax=Nyssa sinensis TaxID=561372 RepID=A0A5J5BWM7_9ASTE|nr:hypothetical protein F0562_003485 [Nyssa sinensis]